MTSAVMHAAEQADKDFLRELGSIQELLLAKETQLQVLAARLQAEKQHKLAAERELEVCRQDKQQLQYALAQRQDLLANAMQAESRQLEAMSKLDAREEQLKEVQEANAALQSTLAELRQVLQEERADKDGLQQQLCTLATQSEQRVQELQEAYEQQLQGLEASRAAVVHEKDVMEERFNNDRTAWQRTMDRLQGSDDAWKARLQKKRLELEAMTQERNKLLEMLEQYEQQQQQQQQLQYHYPPPGQQQYQQQQQQQYQPPPRQQQQFQQPRQKRGGPVSAMSALMGGPTEQGEWRGGAGPGLASGMQAGPTAKSWAQQSPGLR